MVNRLGTKKKNDGTGPKRIDHGLLTLWRHRHWGRDMIQLPMVSPRASKKNCNQSGPYPTGSHIEYIAFEPRGYTVKKHGRRWGMRDLNEIGT